MILFHYTDWQGYNGIKKDGLFPSIDTEIDAYAGPGWYFTDLEPNECDLLIMKACWEKKVPIKKISYYFKYDIHGNAVTEFRPHSFIVNIESAAKFKLKGLGEKPICELKENYNNCEGCELNPFKEEE